MWYLSHAGYHWWTGLTLWTRTLGANQAVRTNKIATSKADIFCPILLSQKEIINNYMNLHQWQRRYQSSYLNFVYRLLVQNRRDLKAETEMISFNFSNRDHFLCVGGWDWDYWQVLGRPCHLPRSEDPALAWAVCDLPPRLIFSVRKLFQNSWIQMRSSHH